MTDTGFSDFDLYLFGEGRHERIYDKLGAHPYAGDGAAGTRFAVWAPNAERVSVVGAFNHWNGDAHVMHPRASSGIWELAIPAIGPGAAYKYEIRDRSGRLFVKADPYGFAMQLRPDNCSVVTSLEGHAWQDSEWLAQRGQGDPRCRPFNAYEVHLGSWRRPWDQRMPPFMSWREAADQLIPYVADLGFTHLELMGVAEHPLDESWGYQVVGYYAATARHGSPQDFMYFVDCCHQAGIGVILDWVPAHFPRDAHGLAHFDGSALYEHADSRLGEHMEWGTKIFNYGRHEVRNFLVANALFWADRYHIDGLRVDAVASMLYLDYSRKAGEWLPNADGGNENYDAIGFLKHVNQAVYGQFPGAITIAEESTAFPGVSKPTNFGGLGFGFKWNMGWMHDSLDYMEKDPVYRRWAHDRITFSMVYSFSENYILPISHDEVVYGKRSVVSKMPGDEWQRFANTRAYYGFMWGHPGKKLLFMGQEFGQTSEWNANDSLPWWLLDHAPHQGLQALVRDLNALYRSIPALHARDCEPEGFRWIIVDDEHQSVYAFLRMGAKTDRPIAVVCNFTPVVRYGYRVGLPSPGRWREALNTDATVYGGSGVGNMGAVMAEPQPMHGLIASASLTLPPLATLFRGFDPVET